VSNKDSHLIYENYEQHTLLNEFLGLFGSGGHWTDIVPNSWARGDTGFTGKGGSGRAFLYAVDKASYVVPAASAVRIYKGVNLARNSLKVAKPIQSLRKVRAAIPSAKLTKDVAGFVAKNPGTSMLGALGVNQAIGAVGGPDDLIKATPFDTVLTKSGTYDRALAALGFGSVDAGEHAQSVKDATDAIIAQFAQQGPGGQVDPEKLADPSVWNKAINWMGKNQLATGLIAGAVALGGMHAVKGDNKERPVTQRELARRNR
jgi:hypothetical protein